jgi:hypothetical protein
VKVFQEVGWGAMADSWPRPAFYAAVKTGDLATSHAQRDMNSLQLQVDGEMLLVDLGHPPDEGSAYFSRARSDFYEVQARAHNTVIVSEEDHRPDAQGTILDSGATEERRWILCDAGDACGEGVRFHRHVIMLADPEKHLGHMLVVLDELDLPSPERIEQFWHTGGRIELDSGRATGRILGQRATLHFSLASTAQIVVKTDRHGLDYGRTDDHIHVSAGGLGRSYFASVFSREPLDAVVEIRPAEKGGLRVVFGETELGFRAGRKHLILKKAPSRA